MIKLSLFRPLADVRQMFNSGESMGQFQWGQLTSVNTDQARALYFGPETYLSPAFQQ
jgi:hypothetical protein